MRVAIMVIAASLATPPAQVTVALPAGHDFTSTGRHLVTVSPDGTRVVYVANNRLYQRAVDGLESVPISGIPEAGGARNPFYSLDGRWIGFWQDRQLWKIASTGGTPVVLCAAQNPQGASWTIDNTILYGQGAGGIWRVSGDGGAPEQLMKVDAGEMAHGPQLLPGTRSVLFTLARNGGWTTAQIVVQSLDTGSRRVVLNEATDARYVSSGHLVYASRGALIAVAFDVATLMPTGPPVRLLDEVAQTGTGAAQFAIGGSRALVYVPSDALDRKLIRTLVWVDRNGRAEPINAPARWYVDPRLSPDGTRVALEIDNDIWIFDLTSETLTRLTSGAAVAMAPIWTPDGRAVIFSSGRSGRSTLDALNLFRQPVDGTGPLEQLTHAATARQIAYAVTPDGGVLIFREHGTDPSRDGGDLMSMPLIGGRQPTPVVKTNFRELNADLSPDGRWLAYQSDESGQDDIYVRPFPSVSAERWRVSSNGGMRPLWARNGQELFYEWNETLMGVALTIGTAVEVGTPTGLFDGPYFYGVLERMHDVSPDGRRFLMIRESRPADELAVSARLIIVPNWLGTLSRRVP